SHFETFSQPTGFRSCHAERAVDATTTQGCLVWRTRSTSQIRSGLRLGSASRISGGGVMKTSQGPTQESRHGPGSQSRALATTPSETRLPAGTKFSEAFGQPLRNSAAARCGRQAGVAPCAQRAKRCASSEPATGKDLVMSATQDVLLEYLLADSRACVESNRRLLSESRYRVAATRRRLNPAFGLSGGSPDNGVLRTTVRERLGSGSLF